MTRSTRKCKYNWDNLSWERNDKSNVQTSCVTLLADEYISIEEGWDIFGPIRVTFSYDMVTKHTQVEYEPLNDQEFDLDNPLEYPCDRCGALRLEPCNGNNPECVFRVFSTKGGLS